MSDLNAGHPDPPADPARRLEQLWRRGLRPELGRFLADVGELAPAQLMEVIRIDQRQRWQAGERVTAEAYFQAYPVFGADPEAAVELVYGEFLMREQLGEGPALEEYQRRFPQYAARLRQQVLLHQAFEDRSDPHRSGERI